MSERREAVRSAALYLQHVRPIDPVEISEYVSGGPHPGVVAADLRSLALELELVELPDGTFVPVPEEPAPPARVPVERFPARYEDVVEAVLIDRYGASWYEGETGNWLREHIRSFKERYLHGAPVTYDADTAAGYAIYHLPAYYAAIQYAVSDLLEDGLLQRSLRVLDVGAGVGGPALGLVDALPSDALLEYHGVEPGEGAAVCERLLEEAGPNVHATVHREPIEDHVPEGRFDLVCCSNVLSELADPEATLERCLSWLEPAGSLLAMAPADRETAIGLRQLERTVEGRSIGDGAVTVYGPTVRFWPGETPSDLGWSFDVRPDLVVPEFQRRLDAAATDPDHSPGEFVNVDVQFAYSILRLDGRQRVSISLSPGRWARMADMERHVTNRIDLIAAKLSHNLQADPGGNPLYKVSDGSESVDHYAVCTRETQTNRALATADYGAPLVLENALALWNDDEEAFNLVVDAETYVEPAG